MKIVNGKFGKAVVYTDLVDDNSIAQVKELLDQPFVEGQKVRMMPDIHAGKDCVVGTTMTVTDKICPNLIGVDIGCLDKDSEVLTPEGWIFIADYNNQKILVYDKETDTAKFEIPLAYIKAPCNKFYHFKHEKGLDQKLSSEHKMLLFKGAKSKGYKQEIKLVQDFVNEAKNKSKLDYYGVKTTFNIKNKGLGFFENLIRILIMISADGRCRYNKDKTKTYVELHFKKQRKIDRALSLLNNANINVHQYKAKNDTTYISFTLDMYFDKSLEMFYKASYDELRIVCDEVYHWDGTTDEKRNHKVYCTTNKKNADVIQFALASQGVRAGIQAYDYPKKANWNTSYSVYQTQNQIVSYGTNANITEVDSSDEYKYCFTTSTGFFVMRRNNCIALTGNCGMLATKIDKKEVDFELLDKTIRHDIPSSTNVRRDAVREAYTLDIESLYCTEHVDIDRARKSIGTLGGGNHFIELDKDSAGDIWLVIHSGSRHLGVEVAKYYQNQAIKSLHKLTKDVVNRLVKKMKDEGRESEIQSTIEAMKTDAEKVPDDLCWCEGELFDKYVYDMRITQEFASINRETMSRIICEKMGWTVCDEFETIHNYLDTKNMIMRKGAVSAYKNERLIIPMNMRDGSLICIGKGNPAWNYSAPHGAGRVMSRTQARNNIELFAYAETMEKAGIWTSSVNLGTIDEAPMAYKPMESIIENIRTTATLIDVIKPIYNFKASDGRR